jgi:hypothetical protein
MLAGLSWCYSRGFRLIAAQDQLRSVRVRIEEIISRAGDTMASFSIFHLSIWKSIEHLASRFQFATREHYRGGQATDGPV